MLFFVAQTVSMHAIKAVILMDNDGNRIISKYYDDTYSTMKEQKAFEKSLFNKTVRANCMFAEVLTFLYVVKTRA